MQADGIVDVTLHHVAVTPATTWSFVSLRLGDGTRGWGEATLVRTPALLGQPACAARQALAGQRLADLDSWIRTLAPADIAQAAIRSALEQAALDARGRQAGCSAATLLNGGYARSSIPLYANINRRTVDRSPRGFSESATHAVAAGYTTLKMAPFDAVTPANASRPEGRALIAQGLQRIAAAKEAAGHDVQIYVDCHWRFDEAAAATVLDEIAALGVTWFECPLPETPDAMNALRQLRARANRQGVRLAGLEELTHADAFVPWLQAGCYDVIMPDVKYAGGISGVLRVGEIAAQYATACAPHNPTGPLCHAASLIACGVGSGMERLEHQYDESPAFHELVGTGLPAVIHGMAALPTGPGLGVQLVESVLDRLATNPAQA